MTKYGDQITYSTADTIADLEKKGYVLVNNEFDQTGQAFGDSSNGHTYTVTLKHGQVPVTPENPGDPGQPINPDDPDGPKWPAGTAKSDLLEDATQTIHYTGAGKDTPKDSVTPHEGAFTKTVTVDKVTGEIVSQTDFTGDPYTFGTVDTPVSSLPAAMTPMESALETIWLTTLSSWSPRKMEMIAGGAS